jgi:transcriptional regulator with PAS, ATPase and Fis domain
MPEALVVQEQRPFHDPNDRPGEPIVRDPKTRAVFTKAARAAAFSSTVLITGESGTGKEVLARRIHQLSARSQRTFVPVNCGALPEALVDSELFGHRKGAFTGAIHHGRGLIDEANGGVLFLDEIGDMPLPLQVRLLRFLDRGEIRAIGDPCVRHVDVRVIAATHRCLESEVRAGRFRGDLFFRLSTVSLHLPPLRERRVDVPALVGDSVRRLALKHQVPAPRVSDDAMALLVQHDWPGNIRELQNALEQALIQQSSGVITPADLALRRASVAHSAGSGGGAWMPRPDHDVIATLARHTGSLAEAAATLGISRTTLWRRRRQSAATLATPPQTPGSRAVATVPPDTDEQNGRES